MAITFRSTLTAVFLLCLACGFCQAQGFVLEWGSSGSTPGKFSRPIGIGIDATGNVYVADMANHRVQKFDANGTFLSAIDAAGSGASISFPSDVAVGSSGIIYIADGNRVHVISSAGHVLGAWPNAASGGIVFADLFGIAVGPDGSVYTTELGSGGVTAPVRVRRFATNGSLLNQWGTRGSGAGQFESLTYLTVDAAGDVYVVDRGNGRIEKFSATGTYQATLGSYAGSSTNDACGKFHNPYGVAVGSDGHVYVSDAAFVPRIHALEANGNCVAFWGGYGSEPAKFSTLGDVALGNGGALYVVDTGNNRVQKFIAPAVAAAHASWGSIKAVYRR